jgi:2-polyprenyl-3-methyl-5-hydroxy-6-metoxy-1,4-benzoquinol methylase
VDTYEVESYIEHFGEQKCSVAREAVLDEKGRLAKAAKIRAVLEDFSARPLQSLDCLDLGCSAGYITGELAKHFRRIVGIDTDHRALTMAVERQASGVFQRASALTLPYQPEAFDVVLCNHVYEHVSNQQALFDEIWRILRPGGFCYLAAGNRLKIIEPHYRLPFLSWFPKPVAHRYLRLMGRGRFYLENHLTSGGLRRLVSRFKVHDYTLKVLREPRRFGADDPLLARLPAGGLPSALLRPVYFALPTYIWILEKP